MRLLLAVLPTLALSACCIPIADDDEGGGPSLPFGRSEPEVPELPPAPAALGDPARSEAARPAWASDLDYAPQAPPEVGALTEPATGPLREGLLACTLESSHVENHIRQRNNVPDLNVDLHFGKHSVYVAGDDNTARVFLTAPLVSLDPQDAIGAQVWDRGFFIRKSLGEVEWAYESLPAQASNRSLTLQCGWVPRQRLEPLVERRLHDAGRSLVAWEPEVDLQAEVLSSQADGAAAQAGIEAAAGMVGWDDPRVQDRVKLYDERRAAHQALLRQALDAQRAELRGDWIALGSVGWGPGTVQVEDGALRVRIPVRPTSGPAEQFAGRLPELDEVELVDAQGQQLDLLYEGIGSRGADTSTPLRGEDTAAFLGMVEDPTQWKPPFLLRARAAGHWVYQQAEAKGG